MTAFLGRNSADDDRLHLARVRLWRQLARSSASNSSTRTTSEDVAEARPSFRTISGNAVFQTFGLPGFQLYSRQALETIRERLASDETSGFLLNNGGGVKINLAGPLRARVDYRIFNLRSGDPRHTDRASVVRGNKPRILTGGLRARGSGLRGGIVLTSALSPLSPVSVSSIWSSRRRARG